MAGGGGRTRKAWGKPERSIPLALAAGAVLAANPAEAATLTVTNTSDSGAGSLRQAVSDASAAAGDDVIVFDPTLFSSSQTISLLSGIAIPATGGALTIQGTGASLLTIQRDPSVSTLQLFNTLASLTMSGVTLQNGVASLSGGAVLVKGNATLTLVDSVLTGNAAQFGGAISVYGGFLDLERCTITTNSASTGGGAISFSIPGGRATGSLLVENSTITGNTVTTKISGPYNGGGGIIFTGTVATSAPAQFTPGSLVIRNSTISSNSSAGSGGGVYMEFATGSMLVQDSTITGNTAGTVGGGIRTYFLEGGGQLTVTNSVISNNSAHVAGQDINCSNPININYSALGMNDAATQFSATSGNILLGPVGAPINFMLGPLSNNGGPTQTEVPQAGSPLINAGSNALVPVSLTSDQRGAQYRRIFGGTVDIGAVEVQPPIPVPAGDPRHLAILAAALAGTALARLKKSRVTGSG
jgi:hypothetical protein